MTDFSITISAVDSIDQCKSEENIRSFCIKADHEYVRNYLSSPAVQTLTNDYITVVIMRTPYSRVQLRIQYLEKYPAVAPIIELSSITLPNALLRNKEKECAEKAREELNKPQFKAIYEHIYKFIQLNLFIPCWKEIRQVMTLCENRGGLGADEKEGILQLRLTHGKYRQYIKLKVPFTYPEQAVEVEFLTSNFPADIQHMFKSQADEIARRCEAGFSGEQALLGSNPIKMLTTTVHSTGPKLKLTSENIKNLKHDVNVLKQMSDLRVAATHNSKKTYVTQATAERREARKDLRRLAQSEQDADEMQHQQLLEEEQNAMKELMRCKVSETAQPSLFVVARFLVEDYVCRLPSELCQACKVPVLPEDPDNNNETLKSKSDKKAMRTFCGHWLHYNCLNEWLTTPPFIRMCPSCDNRRIWHPDWPEDHKLMEKAWQNKQARDREMADVSDFMGMGDQFR